ncbi:hypothetical protein BCAR13_540054 [Paraburkholderia caribensis]|nr:hypothetical protein BCAR13_540054 [Paraburkholderia caribensis]
MNVSFEIRIFFHVLEASQLKYLSMHYCFRS